MQRPELWNPETGEIFPSPIYQLKNERCNLPLEIPAFQGIFVIFRKDSGSPRLIKITQERKPIWNNLPFPNKPAPPEFPENDSLVAFQQDSVYSKPFSFRSDREENLKMLFVQNGEFDVEINNENAEEHMMVYVNNCFSVPLDASWKISFPVDSGAPARYEPDQLKSLSLYNDLNIRHFSGICIYETTFYLTESDFISDRKFLVDLGRVMVSARIFLNGMDAGLAWKFPFVADITSGAKKGENLLKVEVVVPWKNRMTGDEKQDSGMLGPVRLLFGEERYL
jgi:hypothetical protein